jgi:hypothetical protein
MAVPGHDAGVDAQMPAMRGGLFRAVYRHRRFRLNGAMDPNSYAGVLFELAWISRCQILARVAGLSRAIRPFWAVFYSAFRTKLPILTESEIFFLMSRFKLRLGDFFCDNSFSYNALRNILPIPKIYLTFT